MANIQVVIDSTANVSAEILNHYPNLHVVPLKVLLGKQEWPEDELPPERLFELVAQSGIYPTTSQPSIGDFLALFEQLAGQEIIVITLAGALSGTAQGARAAAQMLGSRSIHILDSGTTAVGMIRLAQTALKLAERGKTAAEIVPQLERMAKGMHTLFVPRTLEYLHKGGRIGGAAALFGAILQIKPVLCLVEGQVQVLDKVRTHPKALARMLDELKQYPRLQHIGLVQNDAMAEAEALSRQIRELYPYTAFSITNIGAVLGAHLGPGIVGLVFQEEV